MSQRNVNGPLIALLLLGSAQPVWAKDLNITAAQVERMDINLAQVTEASTEAVALLPGTVVPAVNARTVAAAPFAGTVVQVHVLPGQAVKKGEPLATLSSRELLDAQSQVKQSEAELQMAEAIAKRKRFLADKNITSPVLAEESEAQVAKIRAVLDQHKKTLALGEITLGQGGQYTITSASSGIVVETQAMPGSKLDSMAPAVTIDSSAEVWIEAQVPSELVTRVKPGDSVRVINGPIGKIISIGGSLDRMTRSASMLASVPANTGLLPGQMVTLTIERATETGGLTVPSTAVAWINDKHAVFLKTDAGFALKDVTLRGKSPIGATISGDILPGQQVAATGLPQLESMLAGE